MIASFSSLFTVEALFTLMMLILLQAVLGFDNLLYISLESKKVAPDKQPFVRKFGIGLAIVLRIVLLFLILIAIDKLREPFFEFGLEPVDHATVAAVEHSDSEASETTEHVARTLAPNGGYVALSFNVHSVIVLLGGIFIIYTAFKEIFHLLAVEHIEGDPTSRKKTRSVGKAVFWIVLMNLVFSFDSILSAIALTRNVWVMAIAIVISGVLMIWMADRVAEFLKRNRMYEVLGLFILLIVGVMLVSEGGHLAHIHLFGNAIEPMTKTTFYFVLGIMVVIDIVQSKYQKKLNAQRQYEAAHAEAG